MKMTVHKCSVCDADVYYAVADASAEDMRKVDVEPTEDGDLALAQRYMGPGMGTMFSDDHIILYRVIPTSEVYKGPRRTTHRCPQVKQAPDFCKSCKAPIYWAVTVNAKTMPVDAEPSADGTIGLEFLTGCVKARVFVHPNGSGKLHLSHFATCPDAGSHRRKR